MGATIRDFLKVKGNDVWFITPDTSVLDALKYLAIRDVGALVVLEDGRLVGIISERDFVRSIAQTGQCTINAKVKEYMTRDVFTVSPDQAIEDCMQLMTEKHIRHVPVVEHEKLVGMISIGDVVKEIISGDKATIDQLVDYIEGRGYGR
jgi:CBS domain-containing protein